MEQFGWVSDPTAWLGLGTLVLLELVLGIDNLVFIAILADKLPPQQRDRARVIGLWLALILRLTLLAAISWIATLTSTLFTVVGSDISGRDIILIVGGLFLLLKATMELHERLESSQHEAGAKVAYASFVQVVVQIVALDMIFSLDSVITAVGMVSELSIMVIAVIVASGVMLLVSRPLMAFVGRHPTVVILCLAFLLMIGFSLLAEGFGASIPKGYLYAAIAFSVAIEAFNQIARRNRTRHAGTGNLRDRAAESVLRILGGPPPGAGTAAGTADAAQAGPEEDQAVFAPEEREIIQSVLTLAERPVRSIMTRSPRLTWLDLDGDQDELRREILNSGHTAYPVCRGSLGNLVGVVLTRDLVRTLLETGTVDLTTVEQKPLIVHEAMSVLQVVTRMKTAPVQMAVITDEFGAIVGVVTPTDILEAIVGEMPDDGIGTLEPEPQADGSLLVNAAIDIRRLSQMLDVDLVDPTDRYATLAGYLLHQSGNLPGVGETIQQAGLRFEVVELDGRRIAKVAITRVPADRPAGADAPVVRV